MSGSSGSGHRFEALSAVFGGNLNWDIGVRGVFGVASSFPLMFFWYLACTSVTFSSGHKFGMRFSGGLMFMTSSSFGPKNLYVCLACHGVAFGLIAVLLTFVRRNRCRSAMIPPDRIKDVSATRADRRSEVKVFALIWMKKGRTAA
jgi:hypothetical protein